MKKYNLEQSIEVIENNHKAGAYTTAARDCAAIIERIFREVVRNNIPLMPEKTRLKIAEAELKRGKGQYGMESFGLGEMIGLIVETKFFDIWSEVSGTKLSSLKMIDLNEMNNCRKNLAHGKEESNKQEADSFIHNLNVIIETFGLLSINSLDKNTAVFPQIQPVNMDQAETDNITKTEKH